MANKLTEEERQALGGSTYDQQYFTDEELQAAAKVRAEAEASGDWTSAHNYVEAIRKNYGYSGDVDGKNDGGGYSALASAAKTATTAPTYVSNYADAISSALSAIQNRDAFSYDYETDPSYQSYKKQYVREGQRANADTLGQYAAMTGGMPSTAAVNAASQAQDYYGAKLADVIPELYNAAYSRYQSEGDELYNNLNTLLTLENADYAKYQDQLAQYNYENETNYSQSRDSLSDARDEIDAYLAAGGSASNISAALLEASGYSENYAQQMEAYYRKQNANGTGNGTETTETETQSKSYSSILKNAQSKAKSNLASAKEYIEKMVTEGYITEDEGYYIWSVEIGGSTDSAAALMNYENWFDSMSNESTLTRLNRMMGL